MSLNYSTITPSEKKNSLSSSVGGYKPDLADNYTTAPNPKSTKLLYPQKQQSYKLKKNALPVTPQTPRVESRSEEAKSDFDRSMAKKPKKQSVVNELK